MSHVDNARDWLVTDAKLMLADTEELLKAVGTESKEKIASVKPRIEAAVERAKARIAEAELVVQARARRHARELNEYAAEHPWQTAGAAAALGAALGAIVGVLLTRR